MYQKTSTQEFRNRRALEINSIIARLLETKITSSSKFVLTEEEIMGLCYEAKNIIIKQPMLLEINPPINICGDFHGQFTDMREVFSSVGTPSHGTHYLFLGDYVDRGRQSLECICLLLAFKIKDPNMVFMLRGNHECSELNKIYGFYDECKRRVNIKVWKSFCDCFNCFPIAAVVGDRIFCVHGGISPLLTHLSQINQIKRPLDLVRNTLFCDLLWSDPSQNHGWQDNVDRGVSYTYGPDIIQNFIEQYDFDLICRSHQVVQEGYEFFNKRQLITIFSAPNYCTLYQNKGAVLMIDDALNCHIKQFNNQVSAKRMGSSCRKRNSTPVPQIRTSLITSQDTVQENEEVTPKKNTRSRREMTQISTTPRHSQFKH